ncbi:MAG: S4 domain-containing protein [Bacteroidota bacterium]|nr:S4 domain-containing protein [Bacteroidota bacterium]
MEGGIRIDKWLWAVRLYKTRSIASEACSKGHVTIDGMPVKPSRLIKVNEVFQVRRPPIKRSYRILQLASNRMAASLVPNFMEDITPAEELKIIEMQKKVVWFERDRGAGRPTKKERRDIDSLRDDFWE